ncbi:MAG: acetylxylan esterase [Phycisphaerae bacterium]
MMHSMKRVIPTVVTLVASGLYAGALAAAGAGPLGVEFKPDHANGIYQTGQVVGWTVSKESGAAGAGRFEYTVKENGAVNIKSGSLDLSKGTGRIEVKVNEPAMVLVDVAPEGESDGKAQGIALGAAVSPTDLKPVVPRPADFESFWDSKVKELEAVPANPVLTPGDSDKPGVDFAIIRMDHLNGGHVYGQIAKPAGEGKHPGLVIFQWASPPYPLQKQWVTDRAAEGWLALNIEPHDVLPDQPQAYYDALPKELKNYQAIGEEDRDKSYFLKMYLADYRAVEYMASRPDWDGKTLVVMGTSMGGQQSLCVAGLDPKVTHLIVNVPAGCDLNGGLHGHAVGYPFWPPSNEKIMAAAPYFDAVNFAPKIHATSLVAMGFVDTIAPPTGIWAAFNEIQGPKEAAPMVDSPHNNLATPAQQRPFTKRSAGWLSSLVKTGTVEPNTRWETAKSSGAADMPIERRDRNSQLAHADLLKKAKSGKIDVYFEGDSITRRWGASDPQSAAFLANWNQNFHGWNAADFGWGGDTTQNILWRLENGELDGVNPKVIVIMAGTNNIGKPRPGVDVGATAAEVAKGVEAIVATCEEKAPGAKIVLMGIMPRGDSEAGLEIIKRVNGLLAKYADGDRVRFIDLSDRMLDGQGHLKEGMTGSDHLHPALAGYQVWADALKPVLTELIGPPGPTDSAPAPTGDPSVTNRGNVAAGRNR